MLIKGAVLLLLMPIFCFPALLLRCFRGRAVSDWSWTS